jgi:tetratricopeptide (TPR) repeat protein
VILLGLYYFGASYYLADVNFYKGLTLLGQERVERLERAIELNPNFARYRLILSQSLLFEFFQEIRKPLAEQDAVKIQAVLVRSANQARTATDLQPNFANNWTNSGVIYREIISLRLVSEEEVANWSIKSFEKAIILDPTNPINYTELGKVYLVLGDRQKAREYFQKAQEKKPDYADAIIQEALLLESEDILQEAISKLEDLILKDSWNLEAHFQLGRLYYNAGRVDEAIKLFEAVVFWVPEHSNALYSLGLAYTVKGRTEEAILAFGRVLELNPGNQDVIQKLEELKKPKEEENSEESAEQPEQ